MVPWIALFLAACRPEDGGPIALPDGTELVRTADGGLELWALGRPTFALAGPPEARTFDETVASGLGQWTFARDDEARLPLPLGDVTVTSEGASIALRGGGALTVTPDGPGRTRFALSTPEPHQALAFAARCDTGASFHGFGEQYHATDHRGERFPLLVSEQGIGRDGSVPFLSGDAHTTYFPMPYWLDARGFGVVVDTDHRVEADLCATDPARAWIEAVDDGDLEWVVLHGDTPLDVVGQLGELVGRPATPPSWAFGTWICAQGGRDAVLVQADLLQAEDVPATALWVQDWTGAVATPIGYGVAYRWAPDDGGTYPDLPGLVDELHARGFKVLGYVNPFVDPDLPDHFDEMAAQGWLPLGPDGEPYLFVGPRGTMTQADLTHPDGRAYIRGFLRSAVVDVGLDGWMADYAEWLPLDARVADGSDPVAAHNTAPEAWQRLTREVMDEVRPDGDWVMFARSGWTGVQAAAQIHWAGDQEADFSATDGLPTVVPAMLSLGLAGQPHVTHDVAGFSGGPSTAELYRRWIELGAFTPILRTHDGLARDRNWRFDRDPETLAFFRRFARIHDALRPEIEALAAEAADTGAPIVRHLMLAYPDDPETPGISDQFLLGPDLLVAPVVAEGAVTRELYLPEGRWFHLWSGEAHDGPGWITVDAPIGSPPVFSRGTDRPNLRAIE